jgi:hypothetical protein
LNPEYAEIARRRCDHAREHLPVEADPRQEELF